MMFFFQSLSKEKNTIVYKPLLLIMDGQSNNGGQAEKINLPSYLQGAISPNVKIWDGTLISVLDSTVNNNNGQFLVSSDGAPWPNEYFGAELEIGFRLSQKFLSREIFFVKTGRGGKSLYLNGSSPDFSEQSTGELHDYMLQNVTNFLTADGRSLSDFETWYLWDQGEYDCRTGNDNMANTYETNLINKLDAVKADLGVTDLNIIGRVLSENQTARDLILLPIVKQAQINVLSTYNNAFYTLSESWSLKTDNLHFNSAGQIQKGLEISNIIINN